MTDNGVTADDKHIWTRK